MTRTLLRRRREGEADAGAAGGAILGPDRAALCLDEPARDRETEAGAAAWPRRLASPEALEHPLRRCTDESFAGVLDGDHDLFRVRLRSEEHTSELQSHSDLVC